jgi:hypothetical protein
MNQLLGINQKFQILGVLRPVIIKDVLESCWADDNDIDAKLKLSLENLDGLKMIGESMGLEIDSRLLIDAPADSFTFDVDNAVVSAPFDPHRFVSSLAVFCIQEDKLSAYIDDAYGESARFIFSTAQSITLARLFAACYPFFQSPKNTVKKRRAILREEEERAHELLTFIGRFLKGNAKAIRGLFGGTFANGCARLSTFLLSSWSTIERLKKTKLLTGALTDYLMPSYPHIEERLRRARQLIHELDNCPIGISHWRQYEDLCVKILRFLFVPPFRNVISQARSADKHERRDAILPNNQYSGFWRVIGDEFDSRHIICEFKNGRLIQTKEPLNQLRIYLSKPTIGRFGFLFIRQSPSEALIRAQRNAYEQLPRILILLFDDSKVQKLLRARAYLGSCEELLELEKVKFEITY